MRVAMTPLEIVLSVVVRGGGAGDGLSESLCLAELLVYVPFEDRGHSASASPVAQLLGTGDQRDGSKMVYTRKECGKRWMSESTRTERLFS
jgi:hypothetical protein